MKYADLKPGDELIADGGFTCLKENQLVKVLSNRNRELVVMCADGEHSLDGQQDDDGNLIGFVRAL
jgi:hypothetical protein